MFQTTCIHSRIREEGEIPHVHKRRRLSFCSDMAFWRVSIEWASFRRKALYVIGGPGRGLSCQIIFMTLIPSAPSLRLAAWKGSIFLSPCPLLSSIILDSNAPSQPSRFKHRLRTLRCALSPKRLPRSLALPLDDHDLGQGVAKFLSILFSWRPPHLLLELVREIETSACIGHDAQADHDARVGWETSEPPVKAF